MSVSEAPESVPESQPAEAAAPAVVAIEPSVAMFAKYIPILDHRLKVSYLPHAPEGVKIRQQYIVLSRKIVIKPTFQLKEGSYKKGGRWHEFSRNVYVPGYEALEVSFCDGMTVWTGRITYEANNLSRKKGNKDETWDVDKFMLQVQAAIQFPEPFCNVEVVTTVEKSKEGGGLNVKIKGRRLDGSWEQFMHGCPLKVVYDEAAATNLFLEAFSWNNEQLVIASRANQLDLVKKQIRMSKGNINVNAFDEVSRWSILQWVSYNGFLELARYFLVDHKEKIQVNYRSPFDGNTALHCAVLKNRMDVVKLLIEHGADLYITNEAGEMPGNIALKLRYKELVVFFYGDDSIHCADGHKLSGVRDKKIIGMYQVYPKRGFKKLAVNIT